MASLLGTNIYEPETGISDLLNGRENFLPDIPRGLSLNSKSWKQEAILRLIINHYDLFISRYFGRLPAYEYESLINWTNLRKILQTLVDLESDETAFIFNNSVISVFKTSFISPRVIVINSKHDIVENLDKSYPIYNKMINNNYTRSGINDLIENDYHVFNKMAQESFVGDFEGKLVFNAGFGNNGASESLAVNLNKGVSLIVDMDRKLIEKMADDGFCNVIYEDPDSAFDMAIDAKRNNLSKTIGLVGNASEILWLMIDKGIIPNIVTDATNTSNSINGYFPSGYSYNDSLRIRKADPHHYKNLVAHTIMTHVKAMLEMQKRGARTFEYSNNIRDKAYDRGFDNAYSIPNYNEEYIYPVISDPENINFKWFALSGSDDDIFNIDDILVNVFKGNKDVLRMVDVVNKIIYPKRLPSRNIKTDKYTGCEVLKEINDSIKNEEVSTCFIANTSTFTFLDDKDKFISDPSDINLNELIEQYKGLTMISIDYHGNKDQFFKMTNKSILLDGSKEAEQNIADLI